jgi:hypothetical protein
LKKTWRLGEKETWRKGDWGERVLEKKGLGDLEKRRLGERKPEVVRSLWFVVKSEE